MNLEQKSGIIACFFNILGFNYTGGILFPIT